MPNVVVPGSALAAGLNAAMLTMWQKAQSLVNPFLAKIMTLDGISVEHRSEPYIYSESAPHPEFQPQGQAIPSSNFEYKTFSVPNLDWSVKLQWHRNDRADLGFVANLYNDASKAGENYKLLDERVMAQILTSAADPKLLPAIPLAPDGTAMFAAGRFGIAAGNIVAGSGVATVSAILHDYFSAVAQMSRFLTPAGQRIYLPGMLDKGGLVIFNAANLEVFHKAFYPQMIQGFGAGISNPALASSVRPPDLYPTNMISTDTWIYISYGSPELPMFKQTREPLRNSFATEENSDLARSTFQESTQWTARHGYGLRIPYGIAQVSN